MRYYTSRSLLVTALPLLVFYILYKGFAYVYLLENKFWSKKEWGYLVLLIATLVRVGRLCKVELITTAETKNYLRLLRWRTIGYDALCCVLAPAVLLPVVGFVMIVQPEYLLVVFGYCGVAVGSKLFLDRHWVEPSAD